MSGEEILQYTPINEIPNKVSILRKSFKSGKLNSVDFRLDQLRKVYYAVKDREEDLKTTLKLDLNKSEGDTQLTELNVIYTDILTIINNLKSWVKPKRPDYVPLLYQFSSPKIIKSPIGVVLVISPYNYPLMLSVQPIIAAIAAGNPVILKQSELVPHTTDLLSEILQNALDPEVFQFVNGAIDETTILLNEKFDKILYTGNHVVAKIIAKKAAETLTPVVLELGGKSPLFVTENLMDKHLDVIAKRFVYSKFGNSGQTCVAVDYALVHKSKHNKFIEFVIKHTKKFYGDNNNSRFPHERAIKRLESILNNTNGDIIYQGGEISTKDKIFPPTIIKNVTFEDYIMQEEIFGPILPIIQYDDIDEVIEKVTTYQDTPLALYIATDDKRDETYITSRIRSGAVLVNEGLVHVSIPAFPFGGIGSSGYGNYHGIHGFNTFSHDRAYLKQPYWVEVLFDAKYPPVTDLDVRLANTFTVPGVRFKRTGRVSTRNRVFQALVVFFAVLGLWSGFSATTTQ